jgi:hypothetical protein
MKIAKSFIQLYTLGLIALTGSAPVIEAGFSPSDDCRLSAPCSFGMLWSPDDPHEPHSGGDRPPVSYMITSSTVSISTSSGSAFIAGGGVFGGSGNRP